MNKIKYSLVLLFGIFFVSCSEDFEEKSFAGDMQPKEIRYENIPWDNDGKQLEKFAKGVSEAMKNEMFRKLIKEEALKKFNGDFDVLYLTIKDKPINYVYRLSNANQTFNNLHDFLVPFFDDEDDLLNFEINFPLTTIFVPELPLDYFSAESWDTYDDDQIPDVAIRLDNITYVPVIGRDGENYLIAPEHTPSWPIVVIKENERVVHNSNPTFNQFNTRLFLDNEFRFLDNNFDGEIISNPNLDGGGNHNFNPTPGNPHGIPQHLITAYSSLTPAVSSAWHRDFTYYGLTPNNSTGPLNGGMFSECIVRFKLTGDPQTAYANVANSFDENKRDPMLQAWWQRRAHGVSAWTDGSFEFQVNCFQGNRNDHLGLTMEPRFSLSPNDLFTIEWDQNVTGWGLWRKYWLKPRITSLKTKNLGTRVQLGTWDLELRSNEWKFSFIEVDASVENTFTVSGESKYNNNFEFTGSAGDEKSKVGFKFGGSEQHTRQNSHTFKYTSTSDMLGDRAIHFRDNSVNLINNQYRWRFHSTGNCEFVLAPLQVQF